MVLKQRMGGLIYCNSCKKRDCLNFDNLIPHRSALERDRLLNDPLISVLPSKALIVSRAI